MRPHDPRLFIENSLDDAAARTSLARIVATIAQAQQEPLQPLIRWKFAWIFVAGIVLIVFTVNNEKFLPEQAALWFLNWVHVFFGLTWTGIDLFMGFVIGPILRASPFEARRAIITRLTPKTLFLMPTLSISTGTSGWFLAQRLGFLDLAYPQFYWVVAALAIVTILTIQGLGYLLPTNLRVYFELRKPRPDGAKIGALMSSFFYVVAFQGAMQVAIIVVMARFATGL